jgi:hypothetical protein
MKKQVMIALAVAMAAIAPATHQLMAANQGFDGVISDTMCGRNHMMPGKTPAQCVEECMKAKVNYALVTDKKVYTLTSKPGAITPFAGKHVHIEGSAKDSTITVASIREAK